MGPQGHLLANGPLYRLPENLKLTPRTHLLDIGCGRGTPMRALDEQVGFEQPPAGLDLSPKMLALAQGDQQRDRAPRDLVWGPVTELPFADNSFTLATAGYVVMHLGTPELDCFFREVYRVLVPRGLPLIWEFGPTGNPRLDTWNAKVVTPAGERVRLRSTRTLRALSSRETPSCGRFCSRPSQGHLCRSESRPKAAILQRKAPIHRSQPEPPE
jgi:ubiquinone/menaquinone biosynthesis C-methylase UbiE